MTREEFIKMIDDHDRNSITSESVLIINDGQVKIGSNPKSVLNENEVSLHEVLFDFSRNFNNEAIDRILPEINILLNQNKEILRLVKTSHEADFGNPIYIDSQHKEYKDTDWNNKNPNIHSTTQDGEPLYPISEFKVVESSELFFNDQEFRSILTSMAMDKIEQMISTLQTYSEKNKYLSPEQLKEISNDERFSIEGRLSALTILKVSNPEGQLNKDPLDEIFVNNEDNSVHQFKTEGKVFFKLGDNEIDQLTKKLDSLDMKYGETSQTGNDVVVYDPDKWDSNLKSKIHKRDSSKGMNM